MVCFMANQLETSTHRQKQYGTDGNGLYGWVRNGGWFYDAKHYMDDGKASAAHGIFRDDCNEALNIPGFC